VEPRKEEEKELVNIRKKIDEVCTKAYIIHD
jgi:hypothetical protein